MTNEQINERIAKLCGWTVEVEEDPEDGEMDVWTSPCGKEHFTGPCLYSESLDKCREFEEAMSAEDYEKFRVHLFIISAGIDSDDFEVMKGISCPSHFSRGRAFHNATPLQRCEAFLRMKGQWVE